MEHIPDSSTNVDITVVVVTFRGRTLLPACLDSLRDQTIAHHVLVVDNASTDGSAEYLAGRDDVEVVRLSHNIGFAGGVAAALQQVDTRFVALLNDDAQAEPRWLETLHTAAVNDPTSAAWTSLLVNAERPDTVQNAGIELLATGYGTDLAAGDPAAEIADTEIFGFSGGAALLRTAAVRAVGGFPAEFFLYYEDLDTSWRLRLAGWHIRRVADATVRHVHSATSDQRSELFHFHNERNRLLTLLRCAPAGVAVRAIARFAVTTASLAAKRILPGTRLTEPNLQPRLRLQVLGAVAKSLPAQLITRARIGRTTRLSRSSVWRQWSSGQAPTVG